MPEKGNIILQVLHHTVTIVVIYTMCIVIEN